jgi:hypothetical protein
VIFNERHLRRVLSSYVDYYQRARTHLSLDKDCPTHVRSSHAESERLSPSQKSGACITATIGSLPDSFNFFCANVVPLLFHLVCGSRDKSSCDFDCGTEDSFTLDRSSGLLLAPIQYQFMQLLKFRFRWIFWSGQECAKAKPSRIQGSLSSV